MFHDEIPIRIEYHLTEKGKKLRSILEQMAAFSMRYCCEVVFKDKKQELYVKDWELPQQS